MKDQERELLERIGTRILEIRLSKNLSQDDVAKKCDVDRGKISKIENGTANCYITTLIELAKGLDVSVKDFF